MARQQEVKFWELRASVHLAWHDQGKREEARELLAPVYGWFTEGYNDETVKLEKGSILPIDCAAVVLMESRSPSRMGKNA